jgi:hypothetical protein
MRWISILSSQGTEISTLYFRPDRPGSFTMTTEGAVGMIGMVEAFAIGTSAFAFVIVAGFHG